MTFKQIFVHPKYSENLTNLCLLAKNLWCTWDHEAINLFHKIDPHLFIKANRNPVEFLLTLPRKRINELSEDADFLSELNKIWDKFQQYLTYEGTAAAADKPAELSAGDTIVYLSMEFGLHECIPTYGGGLGILAGDFLKAASDLDLPVVGLGLMYKYGYFTQRINLKGYQEELFVEFARHLAPIRQVRNGKGEKLCFKMNILNESLTVRLWQIDVGKTKLFLLDTDIEGNPPHLRDITNNLYVADREKRLQQELVLGLGGFKALEALSIEPKIYHVNEGHCAFVVAARLKKLITTHKLNFSEARSLIRASTVFTTHTPVIAGNEHFETELVKKYIEPELKQLGFSFEEFAQQGFLADNRDVFWLPALAIRFARQVNCVSKLHRDTSQKIWAGLFPRHLTVEIPIDYVTNGVHRCWISEPFTRLLNRRLGPDHIHHRFDEQTVWGKIMEIEDEQIWLAHHKNKQNFAAFLRNKLKTDLAARGYTEGRIAKLARLFNPEHLTIVFARRFASYKRATLILRDKERLKKILTNSRKPVQMIFAGKAHPADLAGKNMIRKIVRFARDYNLEDHVIFLDNYDMNVARHLVVGADLWLNTPIRNNEASGTSGMKAAINGVLNLSVLDGWWPEGYNGSNGWPITAGQYYGQSDLQEIAEANQIYDLLEDQITELYYDRNEMGIPAQWVKMMKESIYSVYRNFNMNRALKDYLQRLYVPAKNHFERYCQDHYRLLKEATTVEKLLLGLWDTIRFRQFVTDSDKKDQLYEADRIEARCTVNLGKAAPDLFRVELFYMPEPDRTFKIIPMQLERQKGSIAYYKCSFATEGYGRQNLNARIKPANEIVQDLHPELVKRAQ